jgi:hypothetical protein
VPQTQTVSIRFLLLIRLEKEKLELLALVEVMTILLVTIQAQGFLVVVVQELLIQPQLLLVLMDCFLQFQDHQLTMVAAVVVAVQEPLGD